MNFVGKMCLLMTLIATSFLESIKAAVDLPDQAISSALEGIKEGIKAKKVEPYVQMGMYLIGGLIVAILLLVIVLLFKRNNKNK